MRYWTDSRTSSASRHMRVLCAALALWAVAGCMTLEEGGPVGAVGDSQTTRPALNLLSTQQEVQLGAEMSAEVEKQEKVLNDPAIQAYVTEIGNRLARVSTRQDVKYTFKVIDNPKVVNAFALPGGYMYVYTGLMRICDNEAELASVMAHEIGHVAGHHHGEAMTRQMGYNMLMELLLGKSPNSMAQAVGQFIGTGVSARYSRENEREADALGMEYLFRAGYKPEAMITFMEKLRAQEQQSGGSTGIPLFASHPPTDERLARLQALSAQYPLDMRQSSPVYAERYAANVLSKLR